MTLLEGVPEIGGGVLLLLIFALHLGWFPAAGAETAYAEHTAGQWLFDVLHHLALPWPRWSLLISPAIFC
jgi:peptide/nickel transport system permease protein